MEIVAPNTRIVEAHLPTAEEVAREALANATSGHPPLVH
jgi:hypothetical protein